MVAWRGSYEFTGESVAPINLLGRWGPISLLGVETLFKTLHRVFISRGTLLQEFIYITVVRKFTWTVYGDGSDVGN